MATVVFVGGPSGTGKSTIGTGVATKLGCIFLEGDSFHPQANIDKMAQGVPLTDDDRWGWLESLCVAAAEKGTQGEYVVVSCSMLKHSYRDYMKKVVGEHLTNARVRMYVLENSYDAIFKRMTTRKGHYMKADMLRSQLNDFEIPKENDQDGVVVVRCEEKSVDQIVGEILADLGNNGTGAESKVTPEITDAEKAGEVGQAKPTN